MLKNNLKLGCSILALFGTLSLGSIGFAYDSQVEIDTQKLVKAVDAQAFSLTYLDLEKSPGLILSLKAKGIFATITDFTYIDSRDGLYRECPGILVEDSKYYKDLSKEAIAKAKVEQTFISPDVKSCPMDLNYGIAFLKGFETRTRPAARAAIMNKILLSLSEKNLVSVLLDTFRDRKYLNSFTAHSLKVELLGNTEDSMRLRYTLGGFTSSSPFAPVPQGAGVKCEVIADTTGTATNPTAFSVKYHQRSCTAFSTVSGNPIFDGVVRKTL